MRNEPIANAREHDAEVIERFLNTRCEESFTDLFRAFTPQLFAFFRSRCCAPDLAEDLAQEVMLKVYCRAAQIRDRSLFRGWLFKIATNVMFTHYDKRAREVETVDLADATDRVAAPANPQTAVSAPFEFKRWMDLLDSRERELMRLRFVEEWEYHEIAAAQSVPIGTVQWRVFQAKKKLAPYLTGCRDAIRTAV
jgi:RNA polymerase sigma-70 factor, ECF subfamily